MSRSPLPCSPLLFAPPPPGRRRLIRGLATILIAAATVACSSDPTAVSLEMATDKISRDFAEKAIGEFKRACAPLFTTHLADVSGLSAVATDDTSTAIRRLGWGVHIALTMKVKSDPKTLTGLAEPDRRADFLIGGGDKPGFSALSPTAARLCDLTPAPGRTQHFTAVASLAGLLPRYKYKTTDAHREWWADEMRRAMTGDYQSQRNVAWCYVDGCDGVEPIDDVRACAWRLVIAAAKHPKSDASDAANVELDCKTALTPDDQRTARAWAGDLFRKIYKSDLPKAP